MNKNRLEAFSDGVFAILITIMVLELKIPHGGKLEDLRPLIPAFISYVQSFLFISNYWVNHHHLLHTAKKVNSAILLSNMFFLFWLSLVPFATGWVGENGFAPVTVALYGVILIMPAIGYTFLQISIQKTNVWSESIQMAVDKSAKKGKISILTYVLAIPLAFLNPIISEVLFLLVAVFWVLPDLNLEKILLGD